MPELKDFSFSSITFDRLRAPLKNVLRCMGYAGGHEQVPPAIFGVIDREYARSRHLMRPRGVYVTMKIDTRTADRVEMGSYITVNSAHIARLLSKSEYAVIFMVTIGRDLEKTVMELSESGRMTEALALDAIGSETADYAADRLHREVAASKAAAQGFSVTPRFSPGYGDWDISVQRDILAVCRGDEIGISLSDACMMDPQKSVSAIFGLEKHSP